MHPDILISVIVPVYKVEDLLPRCVDSILAQTHRNLEILLVDDGSPDRCGEICEAYAARDNRIRVIHKENGGLSSARNAGIDVARGEYLAFVDSDDWIEPDSYEAMLAMALEEDVKLVCAGRYDTGMGYREKQVGLCPPVREVICARELIRRIFLWDNIDSAAWDKLYHRSLFAGGIRYPLGKIVEDVPTTYRLALLAERAGMLNKPIYNYYHRPGSITTSSVSAKTFHFAEHTASIYPHICEILPQIRQEARYLRVRSLFHAVRSVDMAGKEDRKRFAGEYRSHRKALAEHFFFILTSAFFAPKERILILLSSLGLYRTFLKIYSLKK